MNVLEEQDIENYKNNGFLIKKKFFTESEVLEIKKSTDFLLIGLFHDENTKNRGFESLPLRTCDNFVLSTANRLSINYTVTNGGIVI